MKMTFPNTAHQPAIAHGVEVDVYFPISQLRRFDH
jgi:hypothetical protein